MGTGKILWILFLAGILTGISTGEISLICDVNNPDPNQEITVYMHTDTPLFAMGIGIYVIGDANITTGMCEADCNSYGWDNGWNSDAYIDDVNGWLYLSGVCWASDANGVVSYFKFRYNSGQVSIYFDQEWSCAFSWDGDFCPEVPFSTDILLFGQHDPIDFNEGDSSSQSELMERGESQMDFLSSYDVTITGVHKCITPVSYSNQTILADDNAYLIYDCNFTLINCIMDVNGSVEFNADITLVNSEIRVKGNLKCRPGIQITETGPSSIIATGDSEKAGKITLDGNMDDSIVVISDNVYNDSVFIIINPDSSSNSSLKCIDFYGGWCNIQIYNKRLNEPISNCCFFGADYAIWQNGLDELTDIGFSFFYENYTSIHCNMAPTYNTRTEVWIDNILIDNNYVEDSAGVELVGSQSSSLYGHLKLTNSIFTNCYWSWYFYDSYFSADLTNLAYYNNLYDDPQMAQYQTNALYLEISPFESYGGWPYFINPASPVADVNLGYNIYQDTPQQMLTTLFKEPAPRNNLGFGFGVPLPTDYVSSGIYPKGDFDESGRVDNGDFYVFAADWKSILGQTTIHYPDAQGYSVSDFDKDGLVDIYDFAAFTSNWLSPDSIELTTDSNETLLTAVCQHIDGLSIQHYAFFLDGKFIALKDPNEHPDLMIEKMRYSQGSHCLKAAIITTDGNVFVSETQEVAFNPSFSDLSFDESFDPGKEFTITGKVDEGYIATLSAKNFENQVLWFDSFTSDFITKLNPSIYSGEIEFEVTYSYEEDTEQLQGGQSMMSSSSSSVGTCSVIGLDGSPDNRTAGLILCMMEDGSKDGANWTNTGTCRFAHKMMREAGVIPIVVLKGYAPYNLVRRGMINRACHKYPNIKYAHIYAHGNYETDKAWPFSGNARRTRLLFNDGEWVAFNSRKWKDKGLSVPAGYEYLSKNYEKANYLNQIPFAPGQLKILVIESCSALRNIVTIDGAGLCHYVSGQYEWEVNNHENSSYAYNYPYSDICAGLNMTGAQFVLGGGEEIIKGPYPYYARFFNYFWQSLAEGDTTSTARYNAKFSGVSNDVFYKHRWRGQGINIILSGN